MLAALVLVGLLGASLPALPQSATDIYTDCWRETIVSNGWPTTVTVCINSGGAISTFVDGVGEAPPMIDINLGYDGSGTECWWSTSYETPWVKLGVDGDGVALVGYQPVGAIETVVDAFVPSCTSQPVAATSALASAWELTNRHIHQRPEPSFNPDAGITGLETYLAIQVPPPISDSLVSPIGTTVAVDIKIARVIVDWGDGNSDTFTESAFRHLNGYPNGIARHIYETKTCPTSGGPRCHPELDEYQINVEYDWFVQWRVNTGPWSTIAVPNTTASVPYDVDEIITRSVATP